MKDRYAKDKYADREIDALIEIEKLCGDHDLQPHWLPLRAAPLQRNPMRPWKDVRPKLDFRRLSHLVGIVPCSIGMCVLDLDWKRLPGKEEDDPGTQIDENEAMQVRELFGDSSFLAHSSTDERWHLYVRDTSQRGNESLFVQGVRWGETRSASGYVVAWNPIQILEGLRRTLAHAPQTAVLDDFLSQDMGSMPDLDFDLNFDLDAGKEHDGILDQCVEMFMSAPKGERNDTLFLAVRMAMEKGCQPASVSAAFHKAVIQKFGSDMAERQTGNRTVKDAVLKGDSPPTQRGAAKEAAATGAPNLALSSKWGGARPGAGRKRQTCILCEPDEEPSESKERKRLASLIKQTDDLRLITEQLAVYGEDELTWYGGGKSDIPAARSWCVKHELCPRCTHKYRDDITDMIRRDSSKHVPAEAVPQGTIIRNRSNTDARFLTAKSDHLIVERLAARHHQLSKTRAVVFQDTEWDAEIVPAIEDFLTRHVMMLRANTAPPRYSSRLTEFLEHPTQWGADPQAVDWLLCTLRNAIFGRSSDVVVGLISPSGTGKGILTSSLYHLLGDYAAPIDILHSTSYATAGLDKTRIGIIDDQNVGSRQMERINALTNNKITINQKYEPTFSARVSPLILIAQTVAPTFSVTKGNLRRYMLFPPGKVSSVDRGIYNDDESLKRSINSDSVGLFKSILSAPETKPTPDMIRNTLHQVLEASPMLRFINENLSFGEGSSTPLNKMRKTYSEAMNMALHKTPLSHEYDENIQAYISIRRELARFEGRKQHTDDYSWYKTTGTPTGRSTSTRLTFWGVVAGSGDIVK